VNTQSIKLMSILAQGTITDITDITPNDGENGLPYYSDWSAYTQKGYRVYSYQSNDGEDHVCQAVLSIKSFITLIYSTI
jgi:hypothetical protein